MSEPDSRHDAAQEVLRLDGLRKSYNVGKPTEVEVLHGIDLRLERRDFAALVGASGSGKSTLLNLIGLLDRPTAGELFLLGEPTRTMEDGQRTALRGGGTDRLGRRGVRAGRGAVHRRDGFIPGGAVLGNRRARRDGSRRRIIEPRHAERRPSGEHALLRQRWDGALLRGIAHALQPRGAKLG